MAHASWRVALVESDDLSHVADLTTVARGKSFQITLDRPGSFSFNIPVTDELAPELLTVKRGIKLFKDHDCVWSGMIWNKSSELPSNQVNVNCVGWYEILNHRLLEEDKHYNAGSNRGAIAFSLLDYANAQHPTWITKGSNTHTQTFGDLTTYTKYSSIGQIIQDLSDIESGYDWTINPETRVLDVFDSDNPTVREDVVFAYNKLNNNVMQLSETEDASEMGNEYFVMGTFITNPPGVNDPVAINEYQLFQRTESIASPDPLIVAAYANAEVAINAQPRLLYTFTPFPVPASGSDFVPSLYTDYEIGDIVYLTADYGAIQLDSQPVRVFGTTINIDEEGNERVGQIQTTMA